MSRLEKTVDFKRAAGGVLAAIFVLSSVVIGQALAQDSLGVDSRTWDKLPTRNWTRVDGKAAIGALKALEGDKITLLIKEKEYQFETKRFVSTDQEYIAEAAKFKFDSLYGYDQVTVTSVTAAGISLRHAGGVARKPLSDLSEQMKKHFGVDTLEKIQAKGPGIDKNAWKYSNLDWGSSSEVVGKLLGEKGFKLNDAMFNIGGKARWGKKSASGRYSKTELEYSGGKVMDKEARIICKFANDQLHTVEIWMSYGAAMLADVQKVLDQKYNPNPGGSPKNSWGGEGGRPKNATQINYTTVVNERIQIAQIKYSYNSAVKKMAEAGFEKEEKEAVKKKAAGSDL